MIHPPRILATIRATASGHGVGVREIMSRDRNWRVVEARHAAIRAVRAMVLPSGKHPSYPQIGRWFGRDHSTIIWVCRGGSERRKALLAGRAAENTARRAA